MTDDLNRQDAKDSKGRLPDGWRWVRLGDVAELLPSKSVATDGDTEVKAITTACLTEHGFAPSGVKRARMWAEDASQCVLSRGEILIARSNTPELVGRVAMYSGEPRGAVATDLTIRIWPTADVISEFLTAYLSFLYQTGYWKERAGGASGSMKKITRSQIGEEVIPLPPPAVQQRIAATLNEQMAAVERARTAAETRLEAAKALPTACIQRSFAVGGRQRMSLEDCLEEVSNGVGPDWSRFRVVGATRSGIAPAKENLGKRPERYKLVTPETIFYNPMRILLGSIAMIDEGEEAGITSPDYVVFKTREGRLSARWFYHWLRSKSGEVFIRSLARGAVRERMLFRRLVRGEIELPPWNAQIEAAERMRDARRLEEMIRQHLSPINALPAALLRRAFSGAL